MINVICRHCGEVVPENQAIKVTMWELKSIQSMGATICGWSDDHHTYTQVCIKCYKNPQRILNND